MNEENKKTQEMQDFEDFLDKWVAPGEINFEACFGYILVNKVEWKIVSEFKTMRELDSYIASRYDNMDKFVVIKRMRNDVFFHEDEFTLLKFKSIIKDTAFDYKPYGQRLPLDKLEEQLLGHLKNAKLKSE